MVKFNDIYTEINLNGKKYAVFDFKYKNKYNLPVILDYHIYKKIKYSDSNWFINDKGNVVTKYKKEDDTYYEINLHDVVMKLEDNIMNKSIIHINKINIDNRIENLMYDTVGKIVKKNIIKKKRIIEFNNDCNIIPEDIPSYVWYMKDNDTHGERFLVKIGDKCWKSSSSKKLSLKYKLEETKKYLRIFKLNNPVLFEKYSMNGDLNKIGKELFESFYKICTLAEYKNLVNLYEDNQTNKYLKEDLYGLSENEIEILNSKFV